MGSTPPSRRTASTGELTGRVAGAVLAALRRDAHLTQEDLAHRIAVSPDTVQGWESGRKPLIRASYARVRHLHRALAASGVDLRLLGLWDAALNVDAMIADLAVDDPDSHPLGLIVPDRVTTELLAWPLSGQPPRQLRLTDAALHVPRADRNELAAALRRVADLAGYGTVRSAMLRRQVKFLVSSHDQSAEWLADQEKRDANRVGDLRDWSPEWAVARSAAVAAAHAGDLDPLLEFSERGLATDTTRLANLRYWAYWVGEITDPWDSDASMTSNDEGDWAGDRLLESLLDGVVSAPYRELCAHSLWALLRARRRFATHPHWRDRVAAAVADAMDNDDAGLTKKARQRLDQVHYLVGSD